MIASGFFLSGVRKLHLSFSRPLRRWRFIKSWFTDMGNREFAAYKIGNGEIAGFDFS